MKFHLLTQKTSSQKLSTGYYAKIKAKVAELELQLVAATEQVVTAKAEAEEKRKTYFELANRSHSTFESQEEKKLCREMNAAESRLNELKSHQSNLERQLSPLRSIAQAPEQFAQAKATLDQLIQKRHEVHAAWEKTQTLIARIKQRITALEQRIVAETQAASQTMVETEGELVMPEVLTKLDVEVRVAKATLTELQNTADAQIAELKTIPAEIRDARQRLINARATVIDIELREQLLPLLPLVARATVSAHEANYSRDKSQYTIEVPHELVEAAQSQLDDEMPKE